MQTRRITMRTLFGAVLLLFTCGYTSAYIDERDMKGESIFGSVYPINHRDLGSLMIDKMAMISRMEWHKFLGFPVHGPSQFRRRVKCTGPQGVQEGKLRK